MRTKITLTLGHLGLWLTACDPCPATLPEPEGGTAEQRADALSALEEMFALAVPGAACIDAIAFHPGPIDEEWGGRWHPEDRLILLSDQKTGTSLAHTARHEGCHAADTTLGLGEHLAARGMVFPEPPENWHPHKNQLEAWAYQCEDGLDALAWRTWALRACDEPAADVLDLALSVVSADPTVSAVAPLTFADEQELQAPDGYAFRTFAVVDHGQVLFSLVADRPDAAAHHLVVALDDPTDRTLVQDDMPNDTSLPSWTRSRPERLPPGMWPTLTLDLPEGLLVEARIGGHSTRSDVPVDADDVVNFIVFHGGGETRMSPRCLARTTRDGTHLDVDSDGSPWVLDVGDEGRTARWARVVLP